MVARLTFAITCALGVTSAAAQVRHESQWALGLGVSVLGTGGTAGSGKGFGIVGSYSRMLGNKFGFEAEGRMSNSSGVESIPDCAPEAPCASQTIIPAAVVGADLRMVFRPTQQFRFSAGPALAYAPGALGPNSSMVAGISGGFGVFPFQADGTGLGLEMRGTKFFSPLGEVEWAFGTGLSFRF